MGSGLVAVEYYWLAGECANHSGITLRICSARKLVFSKMSWDLNRKFWGEKLGRFFSICVERETFQIRTETLTHSFSTQMLLSLLRFPPPPQNLLFLFQISSTCSIVLSCPPERGG